MLELTLIRHAESSWSHATLNDYERPLNQRGIDNAPLMGLVLKGLGKEFDLIVSSPAHRAATTTELLAGELSHPSEHIVFEKKLYNADLNTLLDVVQSLPADKIQVALVGHNPGMTEFCNFLCSAGIGNLPTCAIAGIKLAVDDWSAVYRDTGTLELYEYPRKHT